KEFNPTSSTPIKWVPVSNVAPSYIGALSNASSIAPARVLGCTNSAGSPTTGLKGFEPRDREPFALRRARLHQRFHASKAGHAACNDWLSWHILYMPNTQTLATGGWERSNARRPVP